jgi:predicted lipoprotein with Yx(FWY)xxD motif
MTSRTQQFRFGSVAALLGAALVVAGCGSSGATTSSNSSTASAAAAPSTASTASTASQASAHGLAVSTASGSSGTYLTGASGRAAYLWVADSNGKSSCSGACAGVWPPVTTTGTPIASHGVKSADLGTITRSNGTKQVTYKGHPLYYYAADTASGMTKGEGSDSFGAKWWLITPSGSAITSGGSSGAAPAASSSSSAGGGWS